MCPITAEVVGRVELQSPVNVATASRSQHQEGIQSFWQKEDPNAYVIPKGEGA